ncbi:hypothetical protein EVAR_89828_1 [Eumeta japonica]|uniref:Uncharacterized protein n=1 Tax=Eumeta variegata TaxID=151549 RepID=A0A4C1YG40_EUMVA|nr:hypothetical protein EVAR_89828_1 [Eumeta japonica]
MIDDVADLEVRICGRTKLNFSDRVIDVKVIKGHEVMRTPSTKLMLSIESGNGYVSFLKEPYPGKRMRISDVLRLPEGTGASIGRYLAGRAKTGNVKYNCNGRYGSCGKGDSDSATRIAGITGEVCIMHEHVCFMNAISTLEADEGRKLIAFPLPRSLSPAAWPRGQEEQQYISGPVPPACLAAWPITLAYVTF